MDDPFLKKKIPMAEELLAEQDIIRGDCKTILLEKVSGCLRTAREKAAKADFGADLFQRYVEFIAPKETIGSL